MHDTFTLVPNGPALNQQLGYNANAVQIDNYTNQFVRLTGASRDVPPYVFGAVIPLDGSQVADAQLIPALQTSFAPVAENIATLTYYSDALPPDSGHLLATTPQALQVQLGTIANVGGNGVVGDSASKIFTMLTSPNSSGGSQGIGWAPNLTLGGNNVVTRIQITGVTSGLGYNDTLSFGFNSTFAGATEVFNIDQQVLCTCTGPITPNTPTITYFWAYTYNPRTRVSVAPGITIPVTSASPLVTPAGWQAATNAVDINNPALASGSNITIFSRASAPNAFVRLLSVHLGLNNVQSGVTIQGSVTGNVYWRGTFTNSTDPAGEHSYFNTNTAAILINANDDLILHNGTAGAIGVFGTIYIGLGLS